MNRQTDFDWVATLRNGLIFGLVALFVALVGLVEAFSERDIVYNVISMGQTWLLIVGLAAGYVRGGWDSVISRVGDVQQAIPFLVLAIAVAAMLGPGLANLILVLVITTWVTFFRVVRGEVLSVREEQFVWAARSVGCSALRIMIRHILPNVAASIIVVGTLLVANMIIFEASLSFLGLGVPSNTPTWGRIVSDGREYVASEWWISLFPGLAILVTVMGINLLGDALREVLDPRQRDR